MMSRESVFQALVWEDQKARVRLRRTCSQLLLLYAPRLESSKAFEMVCAMKTALNLPESKVMVKTCQSISIEELSQVSVLLGAMSGFEWLTECGKWSEVPGAPNKRILMTWHPEELMQEPAKKKETWRDLKMAKVLLERSKFDLLK